MKKKLFIGLAFVLLVGGIAFTATGGMTWLDAAGLRGTERMVESRINAYWQARMESDTEKMADFVHPLQGSVMAPGMLQTLEYELKDVELEGDTAFVTVKVKSRLKHPIFSSRTRELDMKSRWVRFEGRWVRDVVPSGIREAIQAHRGEWVPPTAQAPVEEIEATNTSTN